MQSEMDMFYGKSNLIWSVMGISKYHRIHTTAGYFQWDPLARHGLHWLSLTMADRVKGRQNASYPGEVSHMSSCFTPLKHGLNYRPVGYPRSSQSWRRSCFVGLESRMCPIRYITLLAHWPYLRHSLTASTPSTTSSFRRYGPRSSNPVTVF